MGPVVVVVASPVFDGDAACSSEDVSSPGGEAGVAPLGTLPLWPPRGRSARLDSPQMPKGIC